MYYFHIQLNAVLLRFQKLLKMYHVVVAFLTLLILGNITWTWNQHIRIISEGSRDTENSALLSQE